MAALRTVAGEWADELREGAAWVIIWKTGRSWNAQAVWLDPDTDTFEPDDLGQARRILEEDPGAVMLNGWHCGHLGGDMTVAELAAGIRWHYENGCNMLDGSTAFLSEPVERPADLPADIPWYGGDGAEMDPYVYDGCMSLEDWELMHRYIEEERKLPQEPWEGQAGGRLNRGRGDSCCQKLHGRHVRMFWNFYRSGCDRMEIEYGSTAEAQRSQAGLCGVRLRKKIYDVRITRRKNVLCLERTGRKEGDGHAGAEIPGKQAGDGWASGGADTAAPQLCGALFRERGAPVQ